MNAPLRTEEERLKFCDDYFASVAARTVYAAQGYREYELPRDVDKELTDRPFYWLWVEKTNQDVPATVLRLAFNTAALERENQRLYQETWAAKEAQGMTDLERMYFRAPTAEYVTLGSFRLEKICESLDSRGRFACVQAYGANPGKRCVPWLMMNMQLSYRCDLIQQTYLSIGCCLHTGQVVQDFYQAVSKLNMEPADPKQMLSTARLSLSDAQSRIHQHVDAFISSQPTDWAQDADQRLRAELKQIQTYYGSVLRDAPPNERALIEAEQARKERELTERAKPRIEVEIRQMALVSLFEHN